MSREVELFGVQLGLLVEASGRVQTSVGRVMRWGLGSVDVHTNESNRDALLRDMEDMKASIGRIERALSPSVGNLPVAPVVSGPKLNDGTVVVEANDAGIGGH